MDRPTKKEFNEAMKIIMRYIEDEPNTITWFDKLLSFYLKVNK